jgi:hypothetical protein
MNKQQRLQIYGKYDGHCAYCGRAIDYREMQVDHIRAKWRSEIYDGLTREEIESMTNFNPSCRMCNFRKGELTIEEFRREIRLQSEREMQRFQARMSAAYGLIEHHPEREVTFYFETINRFTNQ